MICRYARSTPEADVCARHFDMKQTLSVCFTPFIGYIMINYDPFWAYLAEHGISTYKLINSYGVSKGLIDRMKHNKEITTFTINELCNTLDCNLNDIMLFVPDNKENNE